MAENEGKIFWFINSDFIVPISSWGILEPNLWVLEKRTSALFIQNSWLPASDPAWIDKSGRADLKKYHLFSSMGTLITAPRYVSARVTKKII